MNEFDNFTVAGHSCLTYFDPNHSNWIGSCSALGITTICATQDCAAKKLTQAVNDAINRLSPKEPAMPQEVAEETQTATLPETSNYTKLVDGLNKDVSENERLERNAIIDRARLTTNNEPFEVSAKKIQDAKDAIAAGGGNPDDFTLSIMQAKTGQSVIIDMCSPGFWIAFCPKLNIARASYHREEAFLACIEAIDVQTSPDRPSVKGSISQDLQSAIGRITLERPEKIKVANVLDKCIDMLAS